MVNLTKRNEIKEKCLEHLTKFFYTRIDTMINEVVKTEGATVKHSFNVEIENIQGEIFDVQASSPELKKVLLEKDSTESEKVFISQESLDLEED